MEENTQEIQKDETQVEALLEPTPYQNKYKRDLKKEETEDTATVSKDTSSEEEATPDEERPRSEEHTSELQSRLHLVCRLLLEKKKCGQTDS